MPSDWIEDFEKYMEGSGSPTLFVQWGAISILAGAVERKVWVVTKKARTYPNFYVVLTGPAGVGKTQVIDKAGELWRGLEDHKVAPTSVSKASLADALNEASRRVIVPASKAEDGPVESFNSLLVALNELGTFLPSYESEMMNVLTDLWDCKVYEEKKRSSKLEIVIKKPCLNLLAGCTPAYLNTTFPEGAWDQGFASRTFFIYSGEVILQSLFSTDTEDKKEKKKLLDKLKKISELYGRMTFEPEVAQLLDAFHMQGGEPKPEHPRLVSYNSRRTHHLIKLCMIMSVSRSDDLVITIDDFQRALDYMLEAEIFMPEIFKAMNNSGTGAVMKEAWHFTYMTYMKEKKPVLRYRIIRFLQEKVPAHTIGTILDMMEQSKMLEKRLTSAGDAYVPNKNEY